MMADRAENPEDRRPSDPLMRAADAALRRAAIKAQERARLAKAPAKAVERPEADRISGSV